MSAPDTGPRGDRLRPEIRGRTKAVGDDVVLAEMMAGVAEARTGTAAVLDGGSLGDQATDGRVAAPIAGAVLAAILGSGAA